MAFKEKGPYKEHHRGLIMGGLLAVLAVSLWLDYRVGAVVCTPLGTFTSALSLCKPQQGETNWGAAINANWDTIDSLFDAATGRLKAQFGGIPAGAIIMIDSGSAVCPTGFIEVTALRGRYPRGMLAAGETLGNMVGTALTANENRPAGAHTHGMGTGDATGVDGGVAPFLNGNGSFGGTALSTDSGGLVSGTVAPYELVMFCKKT